MRNFFNNILNYHIPGAYVIVSPGKFPFLWKCRLYELLRAGSLPIITYDLSERTIGQLRLALQTTFLGAASCYVITECDLSTTEHQAFCAELLEYGGPHVVICLAVGSFAAHERVLEVPVQIVREEYEGVRAFFSSTPASARFVAQLFRYTRVLPLEVILWCMVYQELLGSKDDRFFGEWFTQLYVPEESLFVLSGAFLGRNRREFARLWHQLKINYPPEFWISFWSDQLCNALIFMLYAGHDMATAKKQARRLPFSFMTRDWKNCSSQDLMSFHHRLAEIDVLLKQGVSEHILDAWCVTWLQGKMA